MARSFSSSKKRLEVEARRAAIKIVLALFGILLFGLLWRLFVGPVRRRERD